MTGRLLALAALALALLSLPSSASAADGRDWKRAVAVAEQAFPPACGEAHIRVARRGELESGIAGRAWAGACRVIISRAWKRWTYLDFCSIVVHEAGHLFGLHDDAEGYPVMAGEDDGYIYPACRS